MLNLSTESQGSIRSFKSSSCSRKNITYVPLNLWYDIVLDVQCKRAGPSLGGAGPNDVLCKTCNVLLCVLEQPSVDNSSLLPLKHGAQLEAIGPIKQWRPYKKGAIFCKIISCYRKFICLCSLLPVSVFNMTLADKLALALTLADTYVISGLTTEEKIVFRYLTFYHIELINKRLFVLAYNINILLIISEIE